MKSTIRVWAVVLAAGVLSGCASMKSHDTHASAVQATSRTGGMAAALAQHEASASSKEEKEALLYNMERAELLRLNKRYADSTEAYLLADAKVVEWEETAKTNPSKLLGYAGAALISERLKVYEGQDYEKVWLTTRLALNRLAAGDLEKSRVDVKRTHEREAVIAELRAKDTAKAEEEAKSKGASTSGKELNGYPVETLNDPEVLKLKNGYQNALSHYLAGFIYEVLGEPGLAAPGYRKAIELKPDTPLLEEGLRGLDTRTGFMQRRQQKMTDVLFIVEAGNAPARKPKAFSFPVPLTSVGLVSISYPVIEPSKDRPLAGLRAGTVDLPLSNVVDLNVMARRALKDEMPGTIARGLTRAIAKATLQNEVQKRAGLLGGLIASVASAATEQADDRMWRMLPGRVYLARGQLPPGEHQLTIDGRPLGSPVTIGGRYAVVPLRVYDEQFIVGEVSQFGQLAVAAAPPPEPEKPAEPQPVAKPAATKPAAAKPAAAKPVAAKPAAAPAAAGTK